MRILSKGKNANEVQVEDDQIFSFDEGLSNRMANGIASVELIHANASRLEIIRDELGAQALGKSAAIIGHATAILKSQKLGEISGEQFDVLETKEVVNCEARPLVPLDLPAQEAINETGYLSVLIGAQDPIAEELDAVWKRESSDLIGKKVLLWVPETWHEISDRYWRYSAHYSSAGHGFSSGSIGPGHAITGEVAEVSLQEKGSITLTDGVCHYDSDRRSNHAPTPPSPDGMKPWNLFRQFQTTQVFEHHSKEPSRLMPRVKIEEI